MQFVQTLSFPKISVTVMLLLMLSFTDSIKAQNVSPWSTGLDNAKVKAAKEKEFILLNFSGSDWCGPCIKMKNDILSSPVFLKYAADHLVLVNADFPRMKKNKQEKALEQQNEKLADQYNKDGKFPYTLLLNKDLKILKIWDGYPRFSNEDTSPPQEFTDQIKEIVTAYAYH